MAGVRITIDDAEVAAAFDRARAGLVEMRPLLGDIGQALVTSTVGRFEAGKGPGGVPWKPLHPRTVKRKRGKTAILIDTANLLHSISYRATTREVEVGTIVRYGAIHQFGGEIEIKARPQTVRRRTETTRRKNKDGTETVFRKGRFVKLQRAKGGGFKAVRGTEVEDIEIGAHTISIPARPFLGVDEADKAAIVDAVEANILALFGGGP